MAVQVYGTYIQFNDGTTQSTAAIAGSGTKAFVSWNSSGTRLNSFNCTSVTVNGTGNYTLNWTNSIGNSTYIACGMTGRNDNATGPCMVSLAPHSNNYTSYLTPTSLNVTCNNVANSLTANDWQSVAIFSA